MQEVTLYVNPMGELVDSQGSLIFTGYLNANFIEGEPGNSVSDPKTVAGLVDQGVSAKELIQLKDAKVI